MEHGVQIESWGSCAEGRNDLSPTRRSADDIDVVDCALTDGETARIAAMDTSTSLLLDHRDPAVIGQLGTHRLD